MKKYFIIISFFLLGSGLSFFIALVLKTSVTVLGHVHRSDLQLSYTSKELQRGDKVTLNFTAYENNLGAIALQLRNYNTGEKKDDHTIQFRIKEEGEKDWITQQNYYGGQFHDLSYFPFGVMPIPDSKGKKYQAEIISLDGTVESKITFKTNYPTLITHYQFNKSELLSPLSAISFLKNKITFALSFLDFYIILFVFYTPFLSVLYLYSKAGEGIRRRVNKTSLGIKKNKKWSVLFSIFQNNSLAFPCIFLILADVFLMKSSYSIVTYVIVGCVAVTLFARKVHQFFIYGLIILFVICVPLLASFDLIDAAEKLAGWVIWLTILGIVSEFFTIELE